MNRAYVYIITCRESGKQYVGETIHPDKRWAGHVYAAEHGGKTKFSRAIRKYGSSVFEFELIAGFLSQDDALLFETQLIRELNTVRNGYNSSEGGRGGLCPSDEVRKKIGDANRGRKPTDEVRKKLSAAAKRRSPELAKGASERFKGKSLSEEHRRKLSEAGKGKHSDVNYSEETRYRMGATNRGKQLSKEHRRKIGEAGLGRKHSEETRQKMRRPKTTEEREKSRQSALARWERIRNERSTKDVEIPTNPTFEGE